MSFADHKWEFVLTAFAGDVDELELNCLDPCDDPYNPESRTTCPCHMGLDEIPPIGITVPVKVVHTGYGWTNNIDYGSEWEEGDLDLIPVVREQPSNE